MREQDIMYLSELIENRIISYCIKEEGSLQEHLNIGEELAHRAMIQALHNIVRRGTSKNSQQSSCGNYVLQQIALMDAVILWRQFYE